MTVLSAPRTELNCQWPMLFKRVDRRIEDVGTCKGGSWRSEGSKFERSSAKTKKGPPFSTKDFILFISSTKNIGILICGIQKNISINFKISTPQSTVYEIKTIMRILS